MNGTLLFILIVLGNAADVWTIRRALKYGASEKNPLLGTKPSTTKLVVAKLLGSAAVLLGLWQYMGRNADVLITGVSIVCAVGLFALSYRNYKIGSNWKAYSAP